MEMKDFGPLECACRVSSYVFYQTFAPTQRIDFSRCSIVPDYPRLGIREQPLDTKTSERTIQRRACYVIRSNTSTVRTT